VPSEFVLRLDGQRKGQTLKGGAAGLANAKTKNPPSETSDIDVTGPSQLVPDIDLGAMSHPSFILNS